jgi:hypothetical protein
MDNASRENLQRQLKVWGALVAFIYALYCWVTGEKGNAVFVLVIATIVLLSMIPFTSNEILDELSGPPRSFLNYLKIISWEDLPSLGATRLRNLFRSSDKFVRFLLIVISVGATALLV